MRLPKVLLEIEFLFGFNVFINAPKDLLSTKCKGIIFETNKFTIHLSTFASGTPLPVAAIPNDSPMLSCRPCCILLLTGLGLLLLVLSSLSEWVLLFVLPRLEPALTISSNCTYCDSCTLRTCCFKLFRLDTWTFILVSFGKHRLHAKSICWLDLDTNSTYSVKCGQGFPSGPLEFDSMSSMIWF